MLFVSALALKVMGMITLMGGIAASSAFMLRPSSLMMKVSAGITLMVLLFCLPILGTSILEGMVDHFLSLIEIIVLS